MSFSLDTLTEEGSNVGSGMQSSSLQEMAFYPVQFYFSCESGFENSLIDCKRLYKDKRKLTYEEIASVSCSGVHLHAHLCVFHTCICIYLTVALHSADIPYCSEEGSINLIHTSSENSSTGVVQICRYGVWIPICGQGWNDFEASLACQQLGFIGEWHFFLAHVI